MHFLAVKIEANRFILKKREEKYKVLPCPRKPTARITSTGVEEFSAYSRGMLELHSKQE